MVGTDDFQLDYASALAQIGPSLSDLQRDLLVALVAAPDNEMSGGQLARLLGRDHHGVVNLEVSRLAKRLTGSAGVAAPQRRDGGTRWWNVIATGRKSEDGSRFLWKLRPQFRDALQQFGIVPDEQRHFPDDVAPLVEGLALRVTVNACERNPVARKRCIEYHGLTCAVCSFDFERTYGPAASGVIPVHHLVPFSEHSGTPREVDPVQDLRPVCPNCHVIIHRKAPPYTIEEVREMLSIQASGLTRRSSGCA